MLVYSTAILSGQPLVVYISLFRQTPEGSIGKGLIAENKNRP